MAMSREFGTMRQNLPHQHPLWFWHPGFTIFDSKLDNAKSGEEDDNESAAEEDEDANFLSFGHLEVPC
jgi:hypothetical protein